MKAVHFSTRFLAVWAALLFCCGINLFAQTQPGSLHGQVTDPSGAVIPNATVTLTNATGQRTTATTDSQGFFDIRGLASGTYNVTANATGFETFQQGSLTIISGQNQKLTIPLAIQVQKQQVEVQDQGTQVEVNPSSNASTLVIKGKDLEALSDDPDELQSELDALAGPSAGPNGGQIYIDGFTGGQLPPKSAIREIRVNQNPFSAQYDRLGYGRVEIFTKPGADKFHGQFYYNVNNAIFNSKNPFAAEEPGYQTDQYSGSIGGPVSKRASFFFNAERRNIDDVSIISNSVRDQLPFGSSIPGSVPNPRVRTSISPRLDFQLTPNNTLTVHYQFTQRTDKNDGVGGTQTVSLPSQAYDARYTENELRVSDTQVLSPRVINETRFEYEHDFDKENSVVNTPALRVIGVLADGGNSIGLYNDVEKHFEVQNYTSIALNRHFVKFGGRLRTALEGISSTNGFNGVFTFPTVSAYLATIQGGQQQASQFSINFGQPLVSVNYVDAEFYGEDDWKLRQNMTLSYGLRFETQNYIHDHGDFAPRVGLAWGLSRGNNTPKTVLRAGFGMFYDRFQDSLIAQAERLNGTNQQGYIINSPDFYPNIPTADQLNAMGAQTQPTIYRVDPHLRASYTMQTGIGLERQITKNATASVTYLNSRGVHQFLTRNINAPEPGTYDPNDPSTAVYPLGSPGNVYQYGSEGIFKQNQLITNFNVRAGQEFSLFGFYTLSYANSNTDGANSFPVDQYDLAANYGRAAFDVRHRGVVGGTFALPYAFRLSPFVFASSGQPFNITFGQDLNGDSIFNDRPARATDPNAPGVLSTPWGLINSNPSATGTLIPRNLGTGPNLFTFNMRLSKTFGFGPTVERPNGGGQGGHVHGHGIGGRGLSGGGGFVGLGAATNRRYSLTFSTIAHNLFNNVNLAPPIGNIDSKFFGQSVALAGGPYNSASANRRIDLQVQFAF